MITNGSIACGSQTIHAPPPYDDSYAYVNGVWRADYSITATCFRGTVANIQEIELLGRVTDTPGSGVVTCYEFNIAEDGSYANLYKWLGDDTSLGNFFQLAGTSVSGGVASGYKFRAQFIGARCVLDVDRNLGAGWQNLIDTTDPGTGGGGAVFATGSPGIGFYRDNNTGTPGANDQFGWTDFTVTEL